ncbi:MAG TPA: hypothetical protein IAC93_08470 [Candidatus Limisoma gallistercoris]|nr:hypothetical protein [Candidatus Limisoma gallistercoris]
MGQKVINNIGKTLRRNVLWYGKMWLARLAVRVCKCKQLWFLKGLVCPAEDKEV